MKHRLATLLLLLALVVPASPASANGFEDMFAIMFRMMLAAMRVMADMADDDNGRGWPGGNRGFSPWSSMSPGMGMWPTSSLMWSGAGMGGWPGSGFGMNPWSSGIPWGGGAYPSSSYGGPWASGRQGGPGMAPYPYPVNAVPMISLLDGKWFGSTGEILEIRGNRFRLHNGRTGITGAATIENNLLKLYTPRTNSLQVYTFVRNQTGLVLQDINGNVLVFQQRPAVGFSPPAAGIRNPVRVF